MDAIVGSRVGAMLGSRVVEAHLVEGGYSGAERWIVALENDVTVFVKMGIYDHTRHQVREEARFYQTFHEAFTPRFLGFEDHAESPLLILEDLSHATWPPPWTEDQIERVVATLEQVASSPPPDYLPSLEHYRENLSGWSRVEDDPSSFLSLGLASEAWLREALPVMKEASDRAVLSGSSLVHFDVRSDNLAFLPNRTVLVDWSIPAVGNPLADIVGWLPSLHLEGGPAPREILGEQGAELVALITGYWASRAGLPPPERAPRVRDLQQAQLKVSLPWATQLLDLPEPM